MAESSSLSRSTKEKLMEYLKETLHQKMIDFKFWLLNFLVTLFVEIAEELKIFEE